jgi:hypothetical protein
MATLLNVLAIIVTLESAWFLGRGAFLVQPETLAELSRPKWGYNLDVARNLTTQVAEVRVGTALLLIAAALQMVALLVPAGYAPFGLRRVAVVVAIVAALLLGVSTVLANRMAATQYAAVEQLLRRDAE